MRETGLSPKDVIEIIRELRGSRVTSLKYRNLFITQCGEPSPLTGQWPEGSQNLGPLVVDAQRVSELEAEISSSPTNAISLGLPSAAEEDELEQLKLSDPERYEKLLEKRELEDVKDTDDQ